MADGPDSMRVHPRRRTEDLAGAWVGDATPARETALVAVDLSRYCPEILKYLALGAGWRVLLGPERADVWFDAKLIDPSPGI